MIFPLAGVDGKVVLQSISRPVWNLPIACQPIPHPQGMELVAVVVTLWACAEVADLANYLAAEPSDGPRK